MARTKDPDYQAARDRELAGLAAARAARNAKILAALAAGESAGEVALRHGLHAGTVKYIASEAKNGRMPTAPCLGTERSVAARARRKATGVVERTRPMTGDPEYTEDEHEFLKACEAFRQASGRPFLLACDYLRVARRLGYAKP